MVHRLIDLNDKMRFKKLIICQQIVFLHLCSYSWISLDEVIGSENRSRTINLVNLKTLYVKQFKTAQLFAQTEFLGFI